MTAMLPLALTALMSGMSLPQAVPPIPLIAAEQPPVPTDALAFGNLDERMTVRVSVDGRGPYEFVVDTGSERTVVSQDLAGLLDLQPGKKVNVTAMTSTQMVNTVKVPSLAVNTIDARTLEAPTLDQADMGAPGMLGLDALKGHVISIDFKRNEMTVHPARRHQLRAGPNDIVVTARNRFGQLIVSDAYYHGQRVSVVVDTGTPISVANRAFLKLLDRRPHSLGTISMLSALGEWLVADYIQVDSLEIGQVTFANVPLAIADAVPFKRFGLQDQPALLLGMNALRLFRQVDIDFANRQIRFSLPDPVMMASGWTVKR
jgi:predicted aspartyl protease